MAKTRVVIVGGGFAGAQCAQSLRQQLSLTKVRSFFSTMKIIWSFIPSWPKWLGRRSILRRWRRHCARCSQGSSAAPKTCNGLISTVAEVVYESHDGQLRHMPYDHVVLACGAAVNLGTVPGMADHALPLKTIGDAIALRSHVMQQLEKAEVCDDPVRKRWYLSFLVVGGGFSGVEVAGEINDLVRGSTRFFHKHSSGRHHGHHHSFP